MSTAELQSEQLRMIDSAAALNAILDASQQIISPRLITVKVQRPSASFMAECDAILARKAARKRSEFEAHADLEASLEYGEEKDVTIL